MVELEGPVILIHEAVLDVVMPDSQQPLARGTPQMTQRNGLSGPGRPRDFQPTAGAKLPLLSGVIHSGRRDTCLSESQKCEMARWEP